MSFAKRRRERQLADRAYEVAARVQRNDPLSSRYAGGNIYSPDDIYALERERLKFWRRRRAPQETDEG